MTIEHTHFLAPYRRERRLGVAMLVVTNVGFLGVPELTRVLIDSVGVAPRRELLYLTLALVGCALLVATTRIASRLLIFNAGRSAEADLRSHLFAHVMTLDRPSTGDVMSRLTTDVFSVRGMWGPGLLNITNASIAFVVVLSAMVVHDPIVTLWAIIPFPLIYLVGQRLSRRMFATMRATQAELGAMSARLQEDFGAIQLIKTSCAEDVRRAAFVAQSERVQAATMAAASARMQLAPILNTLAALGTGILILFGGRALIAGDMTKGEVVAMSGYIARLVWPTLTFGFSLAVVQRGKASWARLAELLAQRPTIADGPEPAPVVSSSAPVHVTIEDLTVTIGDRTILDRVSIELPPRSITAIVGRTGSGKSTLVEALCRLAVVPPNTVFFDGVDVTRVPADAIRKQIGYAPQEAFLFSKSIADNIGMGGDEVEAAATTAGLARDLERFPEGLATIVGERGITLSGGQRQRVALARAIARRPRLLVLDDSLSSVDAETEAAILASLRGVMSDRTTVLISHRIAAIKRADQIIVLDQGKVESRGTHGELLARGGLYAQLYRGQLDFDPEVPPGSPAEEVAA